MADDIIDRLRRSSFAILAVLTLTGCGNRCPENTRYERGEPIWIPQYDAALKTERLVPVYVNGRCVPAEARRG